LPVGLQFISLTNEGKIKTPYHEPNKAALLLLSNDATGITAFANDRFYGAAIPTDFPDFVEATYTSKSG